MALFSSKSSDTGLEAEQGFFGGGHVDKNDFAGSLTCIINLSDSPEGYESGRFHILSLGLFVVLDKVSQIYFSGRLRHGGTPPLAPSHATIVDSAAVRCVLVLYPAGQIVTGQYKMPLTASHPGGVPIFNPVEIYEPK